MRTEMNDNALRQYLGLSWEEFDTLLFRDHYGLAGYRSLDEVSPNLEQLPARMNRPPKADMESDCQLEASSRAAFGRLDALIAENEAFRQARSDGSPRGRTGRFNVDDRPEGFRSGRYPASFPK